jgi:hypothetical protein
MTSHVGSKPFVHAAHAPRPVTSDSDVVVLALVTAQALEAQGEIEEAAHWLRRAADHARSEGQIERVVVLARAAADMTNPRSAPSPTPSSSPPRSPALSTFRRTTAPGLERTTRAAAAASLRSARVFAHRLETRPSAYESALEATLALMTAAG